MVGTVKVEREEGIKGVKRKYWQDYNRSSVESVGVKGVEGAEGGEGYYL